MSDPQDDGAAVSQGDSSQVFDVGPIWLPDADDFNRAVQQAQREELRQQFLNSKPPDIDTHQTFGPLDVTSRQTWIQSETDPAVVCHRDETSVGFDVRSGTPLAPSQSGMNTSSAAFVGVKGNAETCLDMRTGKMGIGFGVSAGLDARETQQIVAPNGDAVQVDRTMHAGGKFQYSNMDVSNKVDQGMSAGLSSDGKVKVTSTVDGTEHSTAVGTSVGPEMGFHRTSDGATDTYEVSTPLGSGKLKSGKEFGIGVEHEGVGFHYESKPIAGSDPGPHQHSSIPSQDSAVKSTFPFDSSQSHPSTTSSSASDKVDFLNDENATKSAGQDPLQKMKDSVWDGLRNGTINALHPKSPKSDLEQFLHGGQDANPTPPFSTPPTEPDPSPNVSPPTSPPAFLDGTYNPPVLQINPSDPLPAAPHGSSEGYGTRSYIASGSDHGQHGLTAHSQGQFDSPVRSNVNHLVSPGHDRIAFDDNRNLNQQATDSLHQTEQVHQQATDHLHQIEQAHHAAVDHQTHAEQAHHAAVDHQTHAEQAHQAATDHQHHAEQAHQQAVDHQHHAEQAHQQATDHLHQTEQVHQEAVGHQQHAHQAAMEAESHKGQAHTFLQEIHALLAQAQQHRQEIAHLHQETQRLHQEAQHHRDGAQQAHQVADQHRQHAEKAHHTAEQHQHHAERAQQTAEQHRQHAEQAHHTADQHRHAAEQHQYHAERAQNMAEQHQYHAERAAQEAHAAAMRASYQH